MRKYHFTYDISKSDNYDEDKEYLLYLFHLTNYESIECYTKSTFIITYNVEFTPSRLFDFLRNNLQNNIYYSISLISKYNNGRPVLSEKQDLNLNRNFQDELNQMDFDVLELLNNWNVAPF